MTSEMRKTIEQALASGPAAPLKGRGNVRRPFGHRRVGFWREVWVVIPEAHKAHLQYSTGSSLAFRSGASNVVVSPEAKALIETIA